MRTKETVMLGYTIERVDSYDAVGLLQDTSYDILGANGNAVIGSHPNLRSAQNFVLWHELETAVQRSAAVRQAKAA
jgi:hypothetical protein